MGQLGLLATRTFDCHGKHHSWSGQRVVRAIGTVSCEGSRDSCLLWQREPLAVRVKGLLRQ